MAGCVLGVLIAYFAWQDLEAVEQDSFKQLFSGGFLTDRKPVDKFLRSSTGVDISGQPLGIVRLNVEWNIKGWDSLGLFSGSSIPASDS